MQYRFSSVSEPGLPGAKWQQLFQTYWPAYSEWIQAQGISYGPNLATSQAALQHYMPEMYPTYVRLCSLAHADDMTARFLTGYQPPAYMGACSQAVMTHPTIQLVRNYDYHPHRIEGTLLLSAWNGKKVIANTDSLMGAVDGMNEDGLVISLAFGGSELVGEGFGIPFILRYVLEFCSTVAQAVAVLTRIPSHMAYNLTVLDRTGAYQTLSLAPNRLPVLTGAPYITNHQGPIPWSEHISSGQTVERAAYLGQMLANPALQADEMVSAFFAQPLYSTRFSEGFGTLYTAVYRPLEGRVILKWPTAQIDQRFSTFFEESKLINFPKLRFTNPYL